MPNEPCKAYSGLSDDDLLWALTQIVFASQVYEHASQCAKCQKYIDKLTKTVWGRPWVTDCMWNEANI